MNYKIGTKLLYYYEKLSCRVSPQADIHSRYLEFRKCSWLLLATLSLRVDFLVLPDVVLLCNGDTCLLSPPFSLTHKAVLLAGHLLVSDQTNAAYLLPGLQHSLYSYLTLFTSVTLL